MRISRDLTSERFGLTDDEYRALVDSTDSILHCAASLNRKSKAMPECESAWLAGSDQLARRAQNHMAYGTTLTFPLAVAGKRQNEW